MKNFHFNTITQEPKELQGFDCACRFIDKSVVIQYHQQWLPKVVSINGKSHFDQLAAPLPP